MQIDEKTYGKKIYIIDFEKIPEKNFKASSIFTAKQILRGLQEFVKKKLFIFQEVPGKFIGEYQRIWTRETVSVPKALKKSKLYYFVDEVSLKEGKEDEILKEKEKALKRVKTILSLAISRQGVINKICFTSPEYKEKIVYLHNSFWFHSLEKKGDKYFWEGDIQICDEILIAYEPRPSTKADAPVWEVVVLNNLWEDLDSFHKTRFHSRKLALELIYGRSLRLLLLRQDERVVEIVRYIEKLNEQLKA